MTSVRVPIVAAVNGPAVGLGCSLTGMSDVVLVEEQAYFSDPHVALGLVAADGGALMWPLLTSLLRAKEYILLGDRVECRRGGADRRRQPGGADRYLQGRRTQAREQRMAKLPPQAVREIEGPAQPRGHRRGEQHVLEGALASETESFDEPAFQANLDRMLHRKKS